MAHPYHHAVSSARQFGGAWQDYIALHHWFDATKAAFPKITHRALRHHTEGAAIGAARFPAQIGQATYEDVARQHLMEDCGFLPSVEHWLESLTAQPWMALQTSLEAQCAESARRFGGVPADYVAVHQWFDAAPPLLRHHAWGIYEAEDHLGYVFTRQDGREIPVRWVGEQHMELEYHGVIPSAQDWLAHLVIQKWMVRGARALSKELAA